jgi:hypothetical protein
MENLTNFAKVLQKEGFVKRKILRKVWKGAMSA